MSEYIDRETLIKNLNKFAPEHYTALVNLLVMKQPAADVVEVKHGKWSDNPNVYECTLCNHWLDIMQGTADMNYCPNCGARMDGDDDE